MQHNFCNFVSGPPRVDLRCGLVPVPRFFFAPAGAIRSLAAIRCGQARTHLARRGEEMAGGLIRQACSDAVSIEGAQKLTLLQSVVGQGFSVLRAGHNLRSLDRLQAIVCFHFFEQSRHIVFDGTDF